MVIEPNKLFLGPKVQVFSSLNHDACPQQDLFRAHVLLKSSMKINSHYADFEKTLISFI